MGIEVVLDERAFTDLVSFRCSQFTNFSDAGLKALYKVVSELKNYYGEDFDLNRIVSICDEYTEYSSVELLEKFPSIVQLMDVGRIVASLSDSTIHKIITDQKELISDYKEQIRYLTRLDKKLLIAYQNDPVELDILVDYAIRELNDYIPEHEYSKKIVTVVAKNAITWIVPTETGLKWLIRHNSWGDDYDGSPHTDPSDPVQLKRAS